MTGRKNILLIDDDIAVREALVNAFESENFHVLCAANGKEAVREFLRNPIDILVLDLNLGLENGWDVFRELLEIRPLLPAIVISAEPQKFAHRAASTVDAILEKPLDLPVLFRTLKSVAVESQENDSRREKRQLFLAEDCVVNNEARFL